MKEYTVVSAKTWRELEKIDAVDFYDDLKDKWGDAAWKNMRKTASNSFKESIILAGTGKAMLKISNQQGLPKVPKGKGFCLSFFIFNRLYSFEIAIIKHLFGSAQLPEWKFRHAAQSTKTSQRNHPLTESYRALSRISLSARVSSFEFLKVVSNYWHLP